MINPSYILDVSGVTPLREGLILNKSDLNNIKIKRYVLIDQIFI